MPTKAEIEAQITATQTALQTAANIIDTGGKLTANELRGLLQNQSAAIGSLLSLLNQNGYNLIDDVIVASNLFTQDLVLAADRHHNLNEHEFHIEERTSTDWYSGMNINGQSMSFDCFELGDSTTNSNTSIGITSNDLYLSARNETYRNRVIRHSPYDGIEIKNENWVPLLKTAFSGSVIEVEYRISANVYPKDQYYFKKETVILSRDSENFTYVIWPSLPAYTQFEGTYSSTTPPENQVTVKSRVLMDDSGYFAIEVCTPDYAINTNWHYEILIRTL